MREATSNRSADRPSTKGQPPTRRNFVLFTPVAVLTVGDGAATAAAQPAHGNRANDCAARDSRGDNVAVVGLVTDGPLVCLQDNRPHRGRAASFKGRYIVNRSWMGTGPACTSISRLSTASVASSAGSRNSRSGASRMMAWTPAKRDVGVG
jgi:hypothetical protein